MDPEQLLLRLGDSGSLADEEREEIAAILDAALEGREIRPLSVDDLYSLLLVIGRAKEEKLRGVLERFLDYKDPLTASLVIDILCLDWGYSSDYLEWIFKFALGVSWDEDDDVKQSAFKIIGEYLRGVLPIEVLPDKSAEEQKLDSTDVRAAELLLTAFSDEDQESWTRQSAYAALLRAIGKEWEEIPSECKVLDFSPGSPDIQWEAVQSVEQLVLSSGAGIEKIAVTMAG